MAERPLSVLFLCTGNSARSQLAEAILRQLSHGQIEVASAGSAPQPEVHPMARAAGRRLLNLDMRDQHPKRLDQFLRVPFDYVITVCDRAAESCPIFPGNPHRLHWSFVDPAAAAGSDDDKQRAFDDVARDLMQEIRRWMTTPAVRQAIDPPAGG